jgi:succinate dehydrogenase/fumarate reductase flavoprotein subunit
VPTDLAAAAERVRVEATRALTELAAGTSMCAMGRSGRSFPAARYHEGRAAAAAVVQRTLRTHSAPPPDALAAAREQWARMSPPLLRRGADGEAYGAGGDDTLDELASLVPAPAPDPPA